MNYPICCCCDEPANFHVDVLLLCANHYFEMFGHLGVQVGELINWDDWAKAQESSEA